MSKLVINLPEKEYALEDAEGLYLETSPAQKLVLEHSLYTISKWESKFHLAYIKKKEKTPEENEYYIRCMIVKPEYDSPDEIDSLTIHRLLIEGDYQQRIANYINDKMCATCLMNDPGREESRETITSELIYYWITKMEMPVDIFEHWHLNRLLTIIDLFGRKDSSKDKKGMKPTRESLANRHAINEARKAKYGTRG